MSNSGQLFVDQNGYVLETELGNYEIKQTGVFETTRTGQGMTPTTFDTTFDGALENAIIAMSRMVSMDMAKGIKLLAISKKEHFE